MESSVSAGTEITMTEVSRRVASASTSVTRFSAVTWPFIAAARARNCTAAFSTSVTVRPTWAVRASLGVSVESGTPSGAFSG